MRKRSQIGLYPFLRLLAPLALGIICYDWFPYKAIGYISFGIGIILCVLSTFGTTATRYRFRWVFGVGFSALVVSVAYLIMTLHSLRVSYPFSDDESLLRCVVTDLPVQKPKSIGIQGRTEHNKKVMLYLEQTPDAQSLLPGDEIIFLAKISAFKNRGNPDDFDYVTYMNRKGYCGTSYLPAQNWMKTGEKRHTLYTRAQLFRKKLLTIYRSFALDDDVVAFISALTLGYKADLSDDIQSAFRTSGTSHVLAVSGLHVGIIYLIISTLLSVLGKRRGVTIVKQIIIIILLWGYALMTGLSISVIRAAIMLTIYCVGVIINRKGFSYNTLCIAAFFILMFRPTSLFDIGFQMSFMAVFSILFFQPIFRKLIHSDNKILAWGLDLCYLSVAAQIGVFPLVLHYFGTFPNYFFIANILIVPLISLIVYTFVGVLITAFLNSITNGTLDWLFDACKQVCSFLINCSLGIVQFIDNLPMAQIENVNMTMLQAITLILFMLLVTKCIIKPNIHRIYASSIGLCLFLGATTYARITMPEPQLVVYNTSRQSEIGWFAANRRQKTEVPINGVVGHPNYSIVRLSEDIYRGKQPRKTFPTDILILSNDNSMDLNHILQFVEPKQIVFDSSLSPYVISKMTSIATQHHISTHDVSKDGAFYVGKDD